jgi:antitoxin YefM
MLALSFSKVRSNFKSVCDEVTNDFETIIVTRERGENVVLMSESEYNNLIENLYVRKNKRFYDELLTSIEQIEKGQTVKGDLVE